jgi:hypothetical protein
MINFIINLCKRLSSNKIQPKTTSNIIFYNIIRILCQNNFLTQRELLLLNELSNDQLIELVLIFNDLHNIVKKQDNKLQKNHEHFNNKLSIQDLTVLFYKNKKIKNKQNSKSYDSFFTTHFLLQCK